MTKPVTVKGNGICFAFPNVCWTPAPIPSGKVPIPYPSIGQLEDAESCAESVLINGKPIVTSNSSISSTTGDEAGTAGGGIISSSQGGKVEFITFSMTVKAEDGHVVRFGDQTTQNDGNAVGTVLGGDPTVLVGG